MTTDTLNCLEDYVNMLGGEARNATDEDKGKAHSKYLEAMEMFNKVEETQMNAYDKEKRREIEAKKNDDATAVEMAKQNMGWKRTLLETGKIVVPVITAALAAVTAIKMQDKSGHLEETGRWTTEASRMAHRQIPNIWK